MFYSSMFFTFLQLSVVSFLLNFVGGSSVVWL